MSRHELPEQQAFTSGQSVRRQPGAKQATPIAQARPPASDVITFTDSAGHLIETDEGNYDDAWPGRLPSSSRRYQYPSSTQGHIRLDFHTGRPVNIPSRRSATAAPPQQTEGIPAARSRRRMHWLWYVGLGATVALVLWIGAAWVMAWWAGVQNDWRFTASFRTFSVDQAVGHDGDSPTHPSHFIVQNDARHLIIIEFPANDASKVVVYSGPVLLGDGQEKTPVTISFQADPQTGRLDMVLHVEDQSYTFLNTGTKFVPPSA